VLTVSDADGGLLLVDADGQLTTEDYFELVTRLEWFANGRAAPVRMLIRLGPRFESWSLDRLLEGLKLDHRGPHPIARIAIVGEARWKDWGAKAAGTGLVGEVRFFEPSRRADADQWLNAPTGGAPTSTDPADRHADDKKEKKR